MALAAAVSAALVVAQAVAPTYRVDIRPELVRSVGGNASMAMLRFGPRFPYTVTPDTNERPFASKLELFENGSRLGPPHAEQSAVQESGGGRFRHWYGGILFSSSDNSDPTANGRSYSVTIKADLDGGVLYTGLAVIAACVAGLYWAGDGRARLVLNLAFGALALGAVLLINREFYSLTHFLPLFVPDSGGYLTPGYLRGWFMPALFGGLHAADETGRIFVPFQLNLLLLSFAALSYAIARITRFALWGWIAFFLLAFNAAVLSYALYIMSEAAFVAALCAHVACALVALRQRSPAWAGLAGATAAIAILVRPVGYCLLAGPLLLAVLARHRRLRIFAASTGAALGLLVLANLPGWVSKAHETDSLAGLALLGQVLHLADATTPTKYPELLQRIRARIEPMLTWRDAPYPREYWVQTYQNYNQVLWEEAAPELQNYVTEKNNAGDGSITLDGVATSLAASIIAHRPIAFLRLIGAEIYGLWAVTIETRQPPLAGAIAGWTGKSVSTFAWTYQAHPYFGREGYDLVAATRQIRDGEVQGLWLEDLGARARPLLTGAVFVLPALILIFGLVVLASLIRGFALAPVFAAVAFCCGEIFAYAVVLGAGQPALDRYAVVLEPLVTATLIVFTAACLSGLPRPAATLSAALWADKRDLRRRALEASRRSASWWRRRLVSSRALPERGTT